LAATYLHKKFPRAPLKHLPRSVENGAMDCYQRTRALAKQLRKPDSASTPYPMAWKEQDHDRCANGKFFMWIFGFIGVSWLHSAGNGKLSARIEWQKAGLNMSEGNGHGDSSNERLDRIEKALNLMLDDQILLREEHKILLTAQVVLTGNMNELAQSHRKLAESQKNLTEAQKHTDDELGVLIRMMNEWIERHPK